MENCTFLQCTIATSLITGLKTETISKQRFENGQVQTISPSLVGVVFSTQMIFNDIHSAMTNLTKKNYRVIKHDI